jgi:putative hemolysin
LIDKGRQIDIVGYPGSLSVPSGCSDMLSLQVTSISIIVFLFFSAFFSASETALFSIPRERFSYFRQSTSRTGRWVFILLSNAQRTLLMILLGNLFVNITLAGLIHSMIGFIIPGSSTMLTMVTATLVIVLFGEMLPKNIALKHHEKIAAFTAPFLIGACTIFSWFLRLIQSINNYFLDRMRIRLRRPSPFITADELKTGIITSRKRGAISHEEQDMIVGVLESGEIAVHKIMIHRSNLILLSSELTVKEALTFLRQKPNNIIYVFNKDNTGEVIGHIPLSELFNAGKTTRLETLVTPMVWVLDSMEIAEVTGILLGKNSTEAAVMDEYGSFSGVVRLTSSLQSMFSVVPGESEVQKELESKTTRICPGATDIRTLYGWLPPELDVYSDDVRTLNGLLTTYLGAIPVTGDKFAIEEYNFYIILASSCKIESVLIRRGNGYER